MLNYHSRLPVDLSGPFGFGPPAFVDDDALGLHRRMAADLAAAAPSTPAAHAFACRCLWEALSAPPAAHYGSWRRAYLAVRNIVEGRRSAAVPTGEGDPEALRRLEQFLRENADLVEPSSRFGEA